MNNTKLTSREHNKNRIDVLGIGAVSIDYVGTVDTWPEQGEKVDLRNFVVCDGGLVGTALAAVAKLGGNAEFIGKLGNSHSAKRAIEMLCKHGVGTSLIVSAENAEPVVSFVLINSKNGERSIFASKNSTQYPFPSELPRQDWHENLSVLYFDCESGMAGVETAKIARRHGIEVIVDLEDNGADVGNSIDVASHIVVSEHFAAVYSGKRGLSAMLKAVRSSSDQVVVITRGGEGCVGLTPNGQFELPAYKIDVVDTTGCGDVFHGAYALGIAREQSPYDAAKFASAAAALCATKYGGREGIPSMGGLMEFMDNQATLHEKKFPIKIIEKAKKKTKRLDFVKPR